MQKTLIQANPKGRPVTAPRVGKARRRVMLAVTIFLWGIIGSYLYFTNESRVRDMAGGYLADLLGGKVTIGGAELSLFEGLRLTHVRVLLPQGSEAPSTLLDADEVFISYNAGGLLTGRLAGTRIVVVNPRVHLAEDAQSGKWNYQRLEMGRWRSPAKAGGPTMSMPEVVLRDAQVDYTEMNGGAARRGGWLALDGRFGASDKPGRYEFSFQSRGRAAIGPAVSGTFEPAIGQVRATLSNVTYGPDIEAMLPALVRQWCRDHNLAGQVAVSMRYTPGTEAFEVRADLSDVEMSVHPPGAAGPLTFHGVAGALIFTNDGVTASRLGVGLENNRFMIDGAIEGYTVDSALNLTVRSQGEFNVAEHLPFTANLPPMARDLYDRFHPSGRGAVTVRLTRASRGGPVRCEAAVEVLDGGFTFADIPYPVQHARGRIVVGPDDVRGFDTVRVVNLVAHGMEGGPNEKAELTVNGWVGPLNANPGGHMDVTGRNIHDEQRLLDSLPPPAQAALRMVEADGKGLGTGMTASFVSHADHDGTKPAPDARWEVRIDLDVAHARACYAGFAYPLEDTGGRLEIRPGYVNLIGVQGKHGQGRVRVDGRITIPPDNAGAGFSPDLNLSATNLAVDESLRGALAPAVRQAVQEAGLTGTLDAAGTVSRGYDLELTIHDGTLAPHGEVEVENVQGRLRVTPQRLEAISIHGRRGDAMLSGHGWMTGWTDFAGGRGAVSFGAAAKNLLLEEKLRGLLPAAARGPWDQLKPAGTVDGAIQIDRSDGGAAVVKLDIQPRDMSLSPRLAPGSAPFGLEHVRGRVKLELGKLAEWDLNGRHGPATLAVAGSWRLDDANAPWDLRLSGQNLPIDSDLIQQMPGGLAEVLRQLGLTGSAGFQFSRLSYRQRPATQPSGANPGPDVEFAVKLNCENGAMSLGVPLSGMSGSADLTGSVRDGRLRELSGALTAARLSMAGRPASSLQATLTKPADEDVVHLSNLSATVAGGRMAGDVAVGLSETGPARFAMSLALEGADVRELTGSTDGKISGEVSASLELSGSATKPSERRGRGDVRVYGAQMYQIPLVLGLFQVTNLALPISSPFERAGARYIIQGDRVTLEEIQLSNKDMTMDGRGHIDFGSKQVDLSFATASPDWLGSSMLGAMWNNAHSELLRIHVKGSIQSPSVSATTLDTVTTTVDQVLKGGK